MLRLGLLFLLTLSLASAQRPITGSAKIQLSLERLQTVGNVLMIAAHPDDENTALLAYFARGRHLRTAYLSLTRGEGGQNLIGSEQGELMGVIRTQELLAARRVDGAEQFFSRAVDFGFSKTAAETLAKWDREKILSDVVFAIRTFQPDVIVLRFSGTPRDGHGQHQASSILGKEAFAAAADPARFPEQKLRPWKAKRLLLNVPSFTPQMQAEAEKMPNKIGLDLGVYDPITGLSFGEVAAISRSQHRSQAMGAREDRGSQKNYFVNVAGDPAATDLLEGVDTTWARVPGSAETAKLLAQAKAAYNPRQPEAIVPTLLSARQAMAKLTHPAIADKLRTLDETIADCLGLFVDASADKYYAVPGAPLSVRLLAVNRSPVAVQWNSVAIQDSQAINKPLAQGANEVVAAIVNVPSSHPFTRQYWLAKPKLETMYAIDDQTVLRDAEQPAALYARFQLTVAGQPLELTRPVWHRYTDRIYGELTRPLVFTPPATVALSEKSFLFADAKPREVSVQITAMQPKTAGVARLRVPAGWAVQPPVQPFSLADAAEQTTVKFQVTPPSGESVASLSASVEVGGREYALSMISVEYPHIPPQAVFSEATAKAVRVDVRTLSRKIGYVMGAGDEVPQALRQLGCEVTLLSANDLATGDLRLFDAIVTGVRAFNTRPDLRANIQRVYDFAAAGGTVVVQYNVVEGGFWGGNPKILEKAGPYPFTTANERITVEESPVEFLATHPLLQKPNRITNKDFEGWVQERGLYFASSFDERYTSLFSMSDPGEKTLKGGTLYAPIGKGAYVFSPLSWFRQLPNGVPGAFRIFANLLSAGKP
jgi:LmbE family N-acetylglucosaminyl deacetylase